MSKFQFFCELIEIGSAFDTPMSFRYRHQSLVPKIIFRKVSPEVDRQSQACVVNIRVFKPPFRQNQTSPLSPDQSLIL